MHSLLFLTNPQWQPSTQVLPTPAAPLLPVPCSVRPAAAAASPTTHPGQPREQATGGKSGEGGGSATSRKNIYKRRRLGSGGSSSLERCYYHFTLGHAAPRTAGCLGVTERPAERSWSWDLAAAGGDGFLNGLEGGTGQESSSSSWLGQHPCTCMGWVPPFSFPLVPDVLPPAPSARDACPGGPQTRRALLETLETSFPCPSLACVCLPPLRSAACQGGVTKGWVAGNDSGPI